MTPEALVAEQKKLEVSVWVRVISTQEHFNQMIIQVRNHLLTLVTAIVGAAALILQKDIYLPIFSWEVHATCFLFIAGLFIILAFYITEKGYHNLLVGAVKHAEGLETQLAPAVCGVGLSQSISKASAAPILFMALKSAYRLRLFYGILCALFISAAVATTQIAPSIPNNTAAGTKALKQFEQSGAYALLLEEVVELAESYIDANAASLDLEIAVAVFDIDETVLSTWDILLSGEFTWDAIRFRNFVIAGKCRRIEPTFRLYNKIKESGIPVIFITSRSEDLRDATAKNLSSEGFTEYKDLIMKPTGSGTSTKEFKARARAELRKAGKQIFLAIGDQITDLDTSPKKGQFLLPNPFY